MEDKTFKTLDDQINILKSRNMRFRDEEQAKFVLINNSYYGIINSYKELFSKDMANDYHNQLFEDILEDTLLLCDFDKNLAAILYKYMMMIETTFKSSLSYYIALELGAEQDAYLSKHNYSNGYRVQIGRYKGVFSIEKTFDKITKKINDNRISSIQHFQEQHGNVPPWIVAPTLSLGVVYEWYRLCKPPIKTNTVNVFLYPDRPDELKKELFLQAMKVVHLYRNIAAHGSRLLIHEIPQSARLKERLVGKYTTSCLFSQSYIYDRTFRIFALFTSICLLLSNRSNTKTNFISEIGYLFHQLEMENKEIYQRLLYRTFLPKNFIELLREI
ncbi:Abi family protein [Enterococcus sp. LJL51]|uniref:Abi family protein n=1 Tax=Enterococcus sp. LJL51 TaxID=3416656 RepID=UPI003CEE1999